VFFFLVYLRFFGDSRQHLLPEVQTVTYTAVACRSIINVLIVRTNAIYVICRPSVIHENRSMQTIRIRRTECVAKYVLFLVACDDNRD